MSKTLIDTNILLRLILRDDKRGVQQAEDLLNAATPGSCRITVLVVSEVLYVLRVLGYERQLSASGLLMLFEHEQFLIDEYIEGSIYLFQDYTLDFVDCYLLHIAIREQLDFKTLDKKAKHVYETILQRQ
jgi:predicted nucleic acid-binding protein